MSRRVDTHGHHKSVIRNDTTRNSLLNDIKTNTANIKIDTGDIDLNTDGLEALLAGGLPSALTGSGNLKVCLQELGNEGSERLNVDVGDDINQLPTALTGEGNLKVSIQEDHTHNLATSAKQDTSIGHLATLAGAITGTEMQVDVLTMPTVAVTLSGGATEAKQDIMETSLNAIAGDTTAINGKITACNTGAVAISSSVLPSGAATQTTLNDAEVHLGNIETSVQLIDNAVDGNYLNVNANISGTDVDSNSGNKSAATQRVVIATDDVNLSAIKSSLDSIDNCVDSNELQVDIVASALPSGASTASLQGGGLPSALSSDNLKVSLKESIAVGVTNTTLTNLNNCIGTNELQVDIVASLPTGSNAIGKLSANSGVDIGDVDVTSLPLTFNSGNKDATCQRVVIATDDVNLSAIKSSLDNIDNAVDGNYLNVNANISGTDVDSNSGNKSAATQRVVIADDDTNLSAIKTAVELLDDCIGTDNSSGPSKCISIGGTNLLGGALQEIAVDGDGHLQIDVLSSALPSGAANQITTNNILTKTTLATSSEIKELLSGITVNAGALSSEFDTENYERIRFFGETTLSVGTDIILMGSNVSGGTFYVLGENLRSETISSTHYVYGSGTENLPRFIKILNKSGSSNYIFTKLYMQLSGGRLAV